MLTNSDYIPFSIIIFSISVNQEVIFRFSSDGKTILHRIQYYSPSQYQNYIFSLENNLIQPISFENNADAIAIIIAKMNTKNAYVAIYQQPISANDTKNYIIRQFNFNNNTGVYE